MTIRKIRKEINTRSRFAAKEADKAFRDMFFTAKSGGNVLTCAATVRFMRCKKIYDHYNNEFAEVLDLPKRKLLVL